MKVAYKKGINPQSIPEGGVLLEEKRGALYGCCPSCGEPYTKDTDWLIYEFQFDDIDDFYNYVNTREGWNIGVSAGRIW